MRRITLTVESYARFVHCIFEIGSAAGPKQPCPERSLLSLTVPVIELAWQGHRECLQELAEGWQPIPANPVGAAEGVRGVNC